MIERAAVALPAVGTRFMVMAPGGENARVDLEPGERKIGVTSAQAEFGHDRDPEVPRATAAVRDGGSARHEGGQYAPVECVRRKNFQPHMTLLHPGSGIDRDLTPMGVRFRELLGTLTFDRFEIDVARK